MNINVQNSTPGGFRWSLFLGILLLISGINSGALLHASPEDKGSVHTRTTGKTDGVPDLLERPADKVGKPETCVLLGIAKAGDRLVAVGERGIIVFSDDRGENWRQSEVPTSVTLTAVSFPTKDIGWAIGHAGTVLITTDAGETWTRQLDGVTAAQLAFDDAKAYAASKGEDEPLAKRYLSDAKLLIDDGPDKPFLDIHFSNEKEGIIVGAYGLILHTGDGGQTWASWMTRVNNPDAFHYYTILQSQNNIYLAGEQGICFRSLDAGRTFQKIDTGYRGSYFTSTIMGQGILVIAGLKGNVFLSIDHGTSFSQLKIPVPVSILTALTTRSGRVVFVNQAGQILQNTPVGYDRFQVADVPRLKAMVASVVQLDEGLLLGVGNNGVVRISLPIENSDNTKGWF